MGAKKLADTLGITIEKAREYIKKFNETFRVLITWLKKNQEMALVLRACSFQELERAKQENRQPVPDLAYAETALGRKRFFVPPKAPPVLEIAHLYRRIVIGQKMDKEGKKRDICNWIADGHPTLNYNPLDPWDVNLPLTLKKYYQRRAGIMREGGNSPIQGGNADITKIAMYEVRKWIRAVERERNNGGYLAHIALQVYDELLATCPTWLSEEMAVKMDELMRKAGERVITMVPVATGCVIADSWQK